MFNFKELWAGIVLIFLLGIGGFLYRTAIESSYQNVGVCSFETKTCPDGSLVGRSGPSCLFTSCLPPNVELPSAGISFVLPVGYTSMAVGSSTPLSRIAAYTKKTLTNASTTESTLTMFRYSVQQGKTASEVIRAHASLTSPELSFSQLRNVTSVTLGTNTFSYIILGKSTNIVRSVYYVAHKQSVFLFFVTENGTFNWSDQSLKIDSLSGDKALRTLLATLQFSS